MHIWGSSLFVLEEYAGEPVCKRRIRDEEILRMELSNNTDAKDIGDLSGKLETVHLNVEKVEFESVEMRDYSKLLIVLYVLKELGLVHRDIRPANVLRNTDSGKLTLIDFAFCCDVDEENYFAGGVSCASNYVLQSLSVNPSEKLKMCWRDDLNSLVRCWILMSNEEVAEGHRLVQRSDSLSLMASQLQNFWSDVGIFPFFAEGVDAVLGVEDFWELTRKIPSLMSFISYFRAKTEKNEEYRRKVGLEVFMNMFKVVFKALLDCLLSAGANLNVDILRFYRCYDCFSLLDRMRPIHHLVNSIRYSIEDRNIQKMKDLSLILNDFKLK
jgi:serine/threonine protein kinase